MKPGYFLPLLLLLAGCQSGQAPSPERASSLWYDMGFSDAATGAVVKDNDALTEWSGNPDVDRAHYLQGYRAGQAALCHTDTLFAWGTAGKDYPASCDGMENAEQLRRQWQQGIDRFTASPNNHMQQ